MMTQDQLIASLQLQPHPEGGYFRETYRADLRVTPDGALTRLRLGNALTHPDAVFQAVVPAGLWFAAECADPASFALVGCTVAPGFEFSEFELADTQALLAQYPQHRAHILRLGR